MRRYKERLEVAGLVAMGLGIVLLVQPLAPTGDEHLVYELHGRVGGHGRHARTGDAEEFQLTVAGALRRATSVPLT